MVKQYSRSPTKAKIHPIKFPINFNTKIIPENHHIMAGGEGGTELYPDLGRHCQHADCGQLDFLPFKCAGCSHFFCLEHRSYGAHDCPKSDVNNRKVLVCEVCSASVDVTGLSDEKLALQRHEKSGTCDPSKKKKPKCPVKRCKEVLTFSNTATCKHCDVKVCLKHRFEPADHACKRLPAASSSAPVRPSAIVGNLFLEAFSARNGKDCGSKGRGTQKKSQQSRTIQVK